MEDYFELKDKFVTSLLKVVERLSNKEDATADELKALSAIAEPLAYLFS